MDPRSTVARHNRWTFAPDRRDRYLALRFWQYFAATGITLGFLAAVVAFFLVVQAAKDGDSGVAAQALLALALLGLTATQIALTLQRSWSQKSRSAVKRLSTKSG